MAIKLKDIWLNLVVATVFFAAAIPLTAQAVPTQTVRQFARAHGFPNVRIRDKSITVSCRFHSFELEGNSRRAYYNGTMIWLNHPVRQSGGEWAISRADADTSLLPLVFPHRRLNKVGARVVVLDAGHGGSDKGAVSPRRVEEKRVNLYLARQVREILRRQGVQVRMTRSDDSYISLEERCRRAKQCKADLFVSIHINSATSSQAHGIETHILPPVNSPTTASSKVESRDRIAYPNNRFDAANMYLGYALQRQMLRATGANDRGVRRSRFYVIRNVECPAALVEGGFISNPAEEHKIIQKAYRDKIARGIAEGILEYLETVRRAHRMAQ